MRQTVRRPLVRFGASVAALLLARACLPKLEVGQAGPDGGEAGRGGGAADASAGSGGGGGMGGGAGDATVSTGGTTVGDGAADGLCTQESCALSDTDCMKHTCLFGACAAQPVPGGVDCDEGGKRCDGAGNCVDCRMDGTKNDAETGTDCGGPDCPQCEALEGCLTGNDCVTGNCERELCVPPTCNDEVLNGDESDTDCGGSCLFRCVAGEACNGDADCESGSCAAGYCCAPDCEGVCRECEPVTGTCSFVPADTDPRDECPGALNDCDGFGACENCSNFMIDDEEGETDVNCGGPVCPPCVEGDTCLEDRDCESCVCDNGTCAPPRCSNGVQDGCESDVDCGGPCGSTCVLGQACVGKADCISLSCEAGVCVAP